MARVVDVHRFLAQYPFTYQLNGAFAIEIQEDKYAPWNNGIYEISIKDGQHSVEKVTQTQQPIVKTTCSVLSSYLWDTKQLIQWFSWNN